MKETEITVEVLEDISSIKNKLQKRNFKILEEVIMTDYYISKYSKEELENFEYSELIRNSFLVRKVVSGNNCEIKLLYKDKVVDKNNNVIAEQKIKCLIADVESVLQIFGCAGLTCWCELQQKMLKFDNGIIQFVSQEVEGLGTFIEYEEDESIKDLNEYEKIQILLNRLKSLDLKIGEDYSCKKVLMKFEKDKM